MTERKMCKFYNLNVPERRSGEAGGTQNHGNNEEEDRISEEAIPPVVPPNEHKLEYNYWMWFSRRGAAARSGYSQVMRPSMFIHPSTSVRIAYTTFFALWLWNSRHFLFFLFSKLVTKVQGCIIILLQ